MQVFKNILQLEHLKQIVKNLSRKAEGLPGSSHPTLSAHRRGIGATLSREVKRLIKKERLDLTLDRIHFSCHGLLMRTAKHASFPFSIPDCPYISLWEGFPAESGEVQQAAPSLTGTQGIAKGHAANCSEQKPEGQTSLMLQARLLQASEILPTRSAWL